MKLKVEIDEHELKKLVLAHMQDKFGNIEVLAEDVKIETKSSQNYRSTWEAGAGFRATYEGDV